MALTTHNIILHLPLPFVIIIMALTLFHNLQYHRIVRFHNVNKYLASGASRVHGFAVKLTDKLGLLILFAFLFSVLFTIPRAATLNMTLNDLSAHILKALLWGVAFHHYVLDAAIWRVRNNQNLRHDLKLTKPN